MVVFVFFKQKTAYEMRISDWSSDVCSSDLVEHDILRFAGDFGERIVTSFWGSFGWFESRLPMAVSIAMTVVVVVAAAAACWRRLPRLVLLLPVATAGAMVLSSGWGAFKKTGVSYATQGRYLFAGAAALEVLVALGDRKSTRLNSSH